MFSSYGPGLTNSEVQNVFKHMRLPKFVVHERLACLHTTQQPSLLSLAHFCHLRQSCNQQLRKCATNNKYIYIYINIYIYTYTCNYMYKCIYAIVIVYSWQSCKSISKHLQRQKNCQVRLESQGLENSTA